jgi:sodium/potassium-transporting ATPase subunit alpha
MNRKFEAVNLRFGKNGERVLGFAKFHLNKEEFPMGYNFNVSNPTNFNFPMENFTFAGLVSLMDPPKDSVPYAVLKCRSAGIKVIMVTGDQPPTAAAIARQVNIISSKTVDEYIEEGFSKEDAYEKAKAIVIHGDMIVKAYEEGEEEGEQKLMQWVSKSQCVFARTTPAQKLKIVRACQRAGNIVGVTGDGVNDSPAIKQADIGIAMGIMGTDVSKDAADMILLNDDFGSIVDGIEEGRKIFDNLKKTIVYLLTSNITEIFPFLAYVTIQIPLPLSNIFMLVICVGTDILPAISLAYEESEVDIMTRKPRKIDEHLVSMKLLVHAYGQMGEIATAAGFFSFFVTMYVYGFPVPAQIGIITLVGYLPNEGDVYYNDPALAFGNTNIPQDARKNCTAFAAATPPSFTPDWIGLTNTNGFADMRQSLIFCNASGMWQQYKPAYKMAQMSTCRLNTTSHITKAKVCYTSESVYYGQSSYFVAIVMVQWSNIISCKSRKASFIYSEFNKIMLLGIFTETCIFLFLLYVPGVNTVFGGRALDFFLLGTPGLCFSVLLLLWVETRKALINHRKKGQSTPNWFERHCLW